MPTSSVAALLALTVLFTVTNANLAYEWTNGNISSCAREARANNTPWLTANTGSYICTNEQWDKYYDPATSLGVFILDDDATDPAKAACPKAGDVIKCFVFASWGQVAGGPDACGDTCSTQMGTGSKSCCAKACVSSGDSQTHIQSSAKCKNNQWMTSKSGKCGSRGDGYCDCCPSCSECVHPPPPTRKLQSLPSADKTWKSYVANRFCDCRKGITVSPDYSPCWNSCLDCFGDDGQVAYMPEDIASSCVGRSSCYVLVKESHNESGEGANSALKMKFPPESGKGYWQRCESSHASSCTSSSTQSSSIPNQPKAKGIVLCGAKDEVVV